MIGSTITYWFGEQAMEQATEQAMEQAMEQVQRLVNVIRENAYTSTEIIRKLHLKGRSNVYMNFGISRKKRPKILVSCWFLFVL